MLKLKAKIQAGALQYVLVISVLIAILLLSFLMFVRLQQQLSAKNSLYKTAIFNVEAGFSYVLRSPYLEGTQGTVKISEYAGEVTQWKRSFWGLFELLQVQSNYPGASFEKTAFVGMLTPEKEALYLRDNFTPLVVVGNSKIVGNARLPESGIKSGNIGGQSYYNSRLIYGNTLKSTAELPSLEGVIRLKNDCRGTRENSSDDLELEQGARLRNTFTKAPKLIEVTGLLHLEAISISGHVLIKSDRKIIVHPSADLRDVLIQAPEVELLAGVTGNFQVFATENIKVGSKVQLQYPSALVLYNEEQHEDNSIIMAKDSEVRGSLVYLIDKNEQVFYKPQIKMESGSTCIGQVYCQGNLELLGEVRGAVITERFITLQFGSTYINHLYNGSINRPLMPSNFAGCSFTKGTKQVVKWVD